MAKEVRRAVMDDVEKIMPLLSSVAQLHADGRKDVFRSPITTHYSESEIKSFVENGELNIFVSTNEANELTGVLLCRLFISTNHNILQDSRTLWIEDTCVRESHRKEGYGKMLLDFAKNFAKENNCSRVELNVWSFNKSAHDFYVSQGMMKQRHTMEYIL